MCFPAHGGGSRDDVDGWDHSLTKSAKAVDCTSGVGGQEWARGRAQALVAFALGGLPFGFSRFRVKSDTKPDSGGGRLVMHST